MFFYLYSISGHMLTIVYVLLLMIFTKLLGINHLYHPIISEVWKSLMTCPRHITREINLKFEPMTSDLRATFLTPLLASWILGAFLLGTHSRTVWNTTTGPLTSTVVYFLNTKRLLNSFWEKRKPSLFWKLAAISRFENTTIAETL